MLFKPSKCVNDKVEYKHRRLRRKSKMFTCATDDFQKSQKNVIFENCVKNLSFEKKIKSLMFFSVARPVLSRLHFDLIKYFTQKAFIFKNVAFCIFNKKKNKEEEEIFSKIPLNCCPCKCTNLGKNSFQYHQHIVRKMRLKSVRL